MNSSYYCLHSDRDWCQRHTIWHSHLKNVGIILSIFTWRHGDHVGVQKDSEKVYWECQSIIMQNLSDVLPLFWTPNWPSHHVSENRELDSWSKQYVERRAHDKKKTERKNERERERREKWETWTERKVYVTENSNNFVPLLLNHKLKYLFTSISKWSCQHERLIPRTITKLGDFYHLMISFGEVRFVKFGIFQSRRNSESRHMNCCKVDIDLKTELFKPRLWVNCVSICTVVGMRQPQTNMLRPNWCRGSL